MLRRILATSDGSRYAPGARSDSDARRGRASGAGSALTPPPPGARGDASGGSASGEHGGVSPAQLAGALCVQQAGLANSGS